MPVLRVLWQQLLGVVSDVWETDSGHCLWLRRSLGGRTRDQKWTLEGLLPRLRHLLLYEGCGDKVTLSDLSAILCHECHGQCCIGFPEPWELDYKVGNWSMGSQSSPNSCPHQQKEGGCTPEEKVWTCSLLHCHLFVNVYMGNVDQVTTTDLRWRHASLYGLILRESNESFK